MRGANGEKLWITYAWIDNEDNNIDYIVNELEKSGVNPIYDRRALIPGQRLWEQIGKNISDESSVDAFSFIITRNSLASEPCKEELAYAVERALEARGDKFPLIGLMHCVRKGDLPRALSVRLCVPLSAPDWVGQVVAAVNRQPPPYRPADVGPYVVKIHDADSGYWIQITPRVEHVSPAIVCVDLADSRNIQNVFCAPAGEVPGSGVS
ncbi:MAG: toll/interleukin-1 receptor domain-containing protein [Defluviicoccus sp.]|nr:MAG: toll/interleukin-1 receptor domain-containing protein [Defluviicoccus sp.]